MSNILQVHELEVGDVSENILYLNNLLFKKQFLKCFLLVILIIYNFRVYEVIVHIIQFYSRYLAALSWYTI